jgi:hypothetical protein
VTDTPRLASTGINCSALKKVGIVHRPQLARRVRSHVQPRDSRGTVFETLYSPRQGLDAT